MALHGFTGNRASWSHLRPYLESQCRVLAVDLPGHGQTSVSDGRRPPFSETVRPRSFSSWTVKAGSETNLLGYSLGARVALGLAVREPRRFGPSDSRERLTRNPPTEGAQPSSPSRRRAPGQLD